MNQEILDPSRRNGNRLFDDEMQDAFQPIQSSRQSLIGRIRTCGNLNKLEWALIFFSFLSIAVGLGFSIYRIATISPYSVHYVFSVLVVVNLVFSIFYLFHGIFQEQPFEIIVLIFTTLLICSLTTINYASHTLVDNDSLKLVRFLCSSIFSIPNVVLGGSLAWRYWSSGHLIFKTVGGEVAFQKMCRTLFFAFTLLIFDAQLFVSCLILYINGGVSAITQEDLVVIIGGTLFTFVWLLIGYVAMRTENIELTWLFSIVCIVQPAYVLYLLVRVLKDADYTILSLCIYISGGLLLLVHFTLMAIVPSIAHNYGKGLKEKVYGGPRVVQPRVIQHEGARHSSSDPLLNSNDNSQNYDAITPAP